MDTRLLTSLAVCLTLVAPAFAADLPARTAVPAAPEAIYSPHFISELRLGASAQDPWSPEKGSANATGEVLFSKPWHTSGWTDVFIPRIHVGGSVNFSGSTSFVYAGFTWDYDITRDIFVEASFGGAFHNGDTYTYARPDHNALGCSPLFRESASLGYRLTKNWSVMATIEHLSNAGFCDQNRGLTNVGARIGYTF
jgi:hypothetical protein